MLLRASFEGVRTTVEANLGGLTDVDYVRRGREEASRLAEQAMRGANDAERALRVGYIAELRRDHHAYCARL